MSGLTLLFSFGLYISPGLIAFALLFVLIPKSETALRIVALIMAFVLMRDAMTPMGLWLPASSLMDVGLPAFVLSFHDDPIVLAGLALSSLALVVIVARGAPELGRLLVWRRDGMAVGCGVGILAGILLALPVLVLGGFHTERFAAHLPWMIAMFLLAYGGNTLEEILFRGFLQGHLETVTTAVRAAVISGIAFGACHAFLAFTVTPIGWPILVFTLAEGLACAFLRMRYGLFPAILAHGTAIFLIAIPMSLLWPLSGG